MSGSRRIIIFGGCTTGGYAGDCNGKYGHVHGIMGTDSVRTCDVRTCDLLVISAIRYLSTMILVGIINTKY